MWKMAKSKNKKRTLFIFHPDGLEGWDGKLRRSRCLDSWPRKKNDEASASRNRQMLYVLEKNPKSSSRRKIFQASRVFVIIFQLEINHQQAASAGDVSAGSVVCYDAQRLNPPHFPPHHSACLIHEWISCVDWNISRKGNCLFVELCLHSGAQHFKSLFHF